MGRLSEIHSKKSFAQWDYIVLTASNEEQAKAFQSQISYRQEKHVLPCRTKYLILPDPDGKRVGSGGATLQVLRKLSEMKDINGDFRGKRILVIHSGGDSKRVPQYSVCGKLFSPVPRELPDGRASTLFDEFLVGMAGVIGLESMVRYMDFYAVVDCGGMKCEIFVHL